MNYADIMNKYRGSQARVKKLQEQLAEELQRQAGFLVELQTHLSDATGKTVLIGASLPKPRKGKNSQYDRDAVLTRIVQLRDEGASFDSIAIALNNEGFKPLSAEKFSQATVYQSYQKHVAAIVTATASA